MADEDKKPAENKEPETASEEVVTPRPVEGGGLTSAELDEQLANPDPEEQHEVVTLYLTGPKFGMTGPVGPKRSPIAMFTNGACNVVRSENNKGKIKRLMRDYACTTDKAKAEASKVDPKDVRKYGRPAGQRAGA